MLKPTDIEELQGKNSRYAVVIGVAKRAREISEEAQQNSEIITEKTVSLAIEDFKKDVFVDKNLQYHGLIQAFSKELDVDYLEKIR